MAYSAYHATSLPSSSTSTVSTLPRSNGLYITLQFLRRVDGKNKFHWGLYHTGDLPPAGVLFHATDAYRGPLDLYQEVRGVTNPLKSKTMVVVLWIARSPGRQVIDECASSVRLMDPRYLPWGETRWTCRVWVKEVLNALARNSYIKLAMDVDQIEKWCNLRGDLHMPQIGRAVVYNTPQWMSDEDLDQARQKGSARGNARNYEPMEIDSAGGRYYGPKPMVTEATPRARYYGPKPMSTDNHHDSRYY